MGDNKDPRFSAWYGSLQATMRSLQLIDRDVEAAIGLPVASIEVLVNIGFENEGRMRMGELADTLLLSRGGATRLVARLADAGLVQREIPENDRRATYVHITPKGHELLEQGMPVLKQAVATHFLDHLDEEDLTGLRRSSLKILERTDSNCDWLVESLRAMDPAAAPTT